MRFFLDTANIEDIKEANSWGVVSGVTTNPTLIAREGRDFITTIKEICSIVSGPVNAEVISTDSEGMIREARELAAVHENIVVKIPMTIEGLKAIRVLSREGIRTNTTLVFSPNQALLAVNAGANYVSPFVGRVDDIGNDGISLIAQIAEIFDIYSIPAEIIAASIRTPQHVIQAAQAGADIATVPFTVLKKMAEHPLTDRGLDKFLSDWKKLEQKA